MANKEELESKIRAAAAAGNKSKENALKSRLQAAVNAENKGDLSEAFNGYMEIYNAGFSPAAFMIGNLYMQKGYRAIETKDEKTGRVIRRPDMKAAYSWYQKAAERGVREALCNVGVMTTLGHGCEKNPEVGKRYLLRAKEAGSEEATSFLFQNFPDQRKLIRYSDEEYGKSLAEFIEKCTEGNQAESHRIYFKLVCGNDDQLSSFGMVLALQKYSVQNPFVNRMPIPAFPKLSNGMPCAPVYPAKRAPGATTVHLNPRCFPGQTIRLTICSSIDDLTIFPLQGMENMEEDGIVNYRALPYGSLPQDRSARILKIEPSANADIVIFTENGDKDYLIEIGWLDDQNNLHFLLRYAVDINVPERVGAPVVLSLLSAEEVQAAEEVKEAEAGEKVEKIEEIEEKTDKPEIVQTQESEEKVKNDPSSDSEEDRSDTEKTTLSDTSDVSDTGEKKSSTEGKSKGFLKKWFKK
jgi:hypothetical protein